MTSQQLLRLAGRRWYVVLLGGIITVAVVWPVSHRPGVYWTEFNVIVLPPTYQFFPNKLENPQYALGPLASLIVSELNGLQGPLLTASADTTLYGQGVRTGAEVRMPNMGNQWQPLYPTATIDIQVVDSTPEAVELRAKEITGQLNDLLERTQEATGVVPSMRATMISSPAVPSIYYVSGSRSRALIAGTLVGVILTIAAVYWLERLRHRKRSINDIGVTAKKIGAPVGAAADR